MNPTAIGVGVSFLSICLLLPTNWEQQGDAYAATLSDALEKCRLYEPSNLDCFEKALMEVADFAKLRRLAEEGDARSQWVLAQAYEKGSGVDQDYSEALKWYKLAAQQGLVDAQTALGRIYYKKAVAWFHRAAEQGDEVAQVELGEMYEFGKGVDQSYREALKWYGRAAEQGYPSAEVRIGVIHYKGLGVSQDYAEAAKWFRSAAEEGYALAQAKLGTMYGLGEGVPQDLVLAHMWSNLAAVQGHEIAALVRDRVAKDMSQEEIAEAHARAKAWKPTRLPWGLRRLARDPQLGPALLEMLELLASAPEDPAASGSANRTMPDPKTPRDPFVHQEFLALPEDAQIGILGQYDPTLRDNKFLRLEPDEQRKILQYRYPGFREIDPKLQDSLVKQLQLLKKRSTKGLSQSSP